MPAYVVTEIDVHDAQRYEEYKKMSLASLQPFGGRFIVRGGKVETLEGNWTPKRFVVVEFPDVARAKAWWSSPEYAPAKKLRNETASSQMIVVEGV
jgi:uncharacterized protein (DUF1330 family)